jgi:hypothetical protein
MSPLQHNLYIRTQRLLGDVSYPGLDFEVASQDASVSVRVKNLDGVCTQTGKRMPWNGRWWRLSTHMTDSEIIATLFKAVITALEHEARESFTFKKVPVYDAHLSVHQLAQLRSDRSSLDVR